MTDERQPEDSNELDLESDWADVRSEPEPGRAFEMEVEPIPPEPIRNPCAEIPLGVHERQLNERPLTLAQLAQMPGQLRPPDGIDLLAERLDRDRAAIALVDYFNGGPDPTDGIDQLAEQLVGDGETFTNRPIRGFEDIEPTPFDDPELDEPVPERAQPEHRCEGLRDGEACPVCGETHQAPPSRYELLMED